VVFCPAISSTPGIFSSRAVTVQKKTKAWVPAPKHPAGEEHLRRVRRICIALPDTAEKLSHGEPTFFVRKKVFAMFDNNHHHDNHVAVWVPVPPGLQAQLLRTEPGKFFLPPYVGVKGWVGIELPLIDDEELASHRREAWRLVAPKTLGKAKMDSFATRSRD
jgi:hypothetical protein